MEDRLVENNDMLANMNEVYEERERIYEEREKEYKRNRKILSDLVESAKSKLLVISSEREQLDEREKTLDNRTTILNETEEKLRIHSEQIEQKNKVLEKERYSFEKEKSRSFAEIRFQKEQLKNEQIKARQLQEELQTQLTMLGFFTDEEENPLEYLQKIVPQENTADLRQLQEENVKLMTELDGFRSSCSNLTKQLQIANETLKEKDEELNRKNEEWQKERQELISTFAKSYEKKESSNEKIQVTDDTDEGWEEPIEEDQQTRVDEKEQIYEELTAEVLKKYIDKNEPQCTDLEIKHAESGEQLHFNVNDKKFVFSFSAPSFFEISVCRKNSSRLKKILAHYNEIYSDVKFKFENEHVYARGYFSNTTSVNDLMDRVWKISQHFE